MKILIVDDNEDSVEFTSRVLKDCNCDILKAYSGYSGLESAKKYRPDLILLDIMMPDIDGFRVCEILMADPVTDMIPIIMVTAKTELKDLEKGLTAGAYDYIRKPFESKELYARVRAALRFKKNQDELIDAKIRLEEMNEELAHLAVTDSLTQIYNHTFLLNALKFELNRSERFSKSMAFFMIDIDNFKDINDNYGHLVGDDVLKEVVRIIKGPIRTVDVLGRYGGEEFGLILTETDEPGAMILAEKIRKNIEEHDFIVTGREREKSIRLTISIGVAIYPDNKTKDILTIIKDADDALYLAKREGKNRVFKIN